MIIEPVVGIQKKDTVLSEKEFLSASIFSTASMLRDYFDKYGYHFIGFYEESEDLVVVKDNNPEVAVMTGDYDVYRVYNYKTGEIVVRLLNVEQAGKNLFATGKRKVLSFTHTIETSDSSMKLIDKNTSLTILEAEFMSFLSSDKVLVINFGFESIYSILDGRSYPLIKDDSHIYIGKDSTQFIDMRFGMYVVFQNTIMPLYANYIDLFDIVKRYPYGEKYNGRFRLLTSPIKYGIFYKNEDNSYMKWYNSSDERNQVLSSLGVLVEETLAKEPVKVKKD